MHLMLCSQVKESLHLYWQDGLVGKTIHHQALWLEFHFLGPDGGKREPDPDLYIHEVTHEHVQEEYSYQE